MAERDAIACLGAGRMGRGIAVAFAYAGHEVTLVDFKPRDAQTFDTLKTETLADIRTTFQSIARLNALSAHHVETLMNRVRVVPQVAAVDALNKVAMVFEGIPEIVDLKRAAFADLSPHLNPNIIIASTTSTILVDDLSPALTHPDRFLNAHWLNPAYLVPLVEISPGANTSSAATKRVTDILESIGKVPVVCAATPGYIVPRIQALAMNEAARMVEEGVASAADIDKAIKYGFGFRFAVLGLLEFIDWGGGDILYYASRYLEGALGNERYAAPDIIESNMKAGRIGLRTGQGFLDYASMDIDAYRERRLAELSAQLKTLGLARPPVLD